MSHSEEDSALSNGVADNDDGGVYTASPRCGRDGGRDGRSGSGSGSGSCSGNRGGSGSDDKAQVGPVAADAKPGSRVPVSSAACVGREVEAARAKPDTVRMPASNAK